MRLPALAFAAALAGCAAPPAPPPPTAVTLSLSATPDVNATPTGTGTPIVLRIYQLGGAAGLANGEFFQLYNADAATLGTDLVKRDDIPLNPGQKNSLTLAPLDTVHTIGVFAGYRDFQHVTWRGSVDIPPHQTTAITVSATAAGITVKAAPPPAKPAS